MKKNIWLKHNSSGNVLEIRIRDSGTTFEKFTFDPSNSFDFGKALTKIEEKYGWSPKFRKEKDSIKWLDMGQDY